MRKSSWMIMAAAAGFAALVFYWLTTSQPIEVVGSHLERVGDRVYVTGEVRNTGDRARSVDLEVHYFDRSGHALGEDRLSIDGLKASGVRRFTSPAHTLAGVAQYSIYLNNGRDPYGN